MIERYCLDTSFLVNGWRKTYHPNVFPTLWTALDDLIAKGTVFSCEEVYLEIQKKTDDLAGWAKARKSAFLVPDDHVTLEMQNIMTKFRNFAAMGGSLNQADPWVVSVARVIGAVVVTDEQKAEKQKATKPPKLPNVCEAVHVGWMSPIQFLAAVNMKF